ncbi:MAG: hypothetical protein K2G80_05140 [Bacteroidales bacterium]|nr:hypothetical protein [Bacteroidales bacterium]
MRNKVLICVISLMTMCISAAYAQNKESKIFCHEPNDTVVIERPEIGGAKVYLLKEGFKSAKEFDEADIAHNMGKEMTPTGIGTGKMLRIGGTNITDNGKMEN